MTDNTPIGFQLYEEEVEVMEADPEDCSMTVDVQKQHSVHVDVVSPVAI